MATAASGRGALVADPGGFIHCFGGLTWLILELVQGFQFGTWHVKCLLSCFPAASVQRFTFFNMTAAGSIPVRYVRRSFD